MRVTHVEVVVPPARVRPWLVVNLAEKIRDLLRDPAAREWLGRNARKTVRDHRGAVGRTVEIVREYLKGSEPQASWSASS